MPDRTTSAIIAAIALGAFLGVAVMATIGSTRPAQQPRCRVVLHASDGSTIDAWDSVHPTIKADGSITFYDSGLDWQIIGGTVVITKDPSQ